jgi:hypothetical protein
MPKETKQKRMPRKAMLKYTTKEDGTTYSSARAFKKGMGASPIKVAKLQAKQYKTMPKTPKTALKK